MTDRTDNIPLRDPSHLFTSDIYLNHSAVFWPDVDKDHPDNAIWRLVGEPCTLKYWQFESAQMLIDKAGNGGLNLAALWIVDGMLADKDFWYLLSGGDKDTFRWAWRMLGLEFGYSPRWMSQVGLMNPHNNGDFCGK